MFENKISNILKLATCILLCQAVGITSGLLTTSENNAWYSTVIKPSWNPPGYLFAPVWTVLYLLMAIALWLVWRYPIVSATKTKAMFLFALQLFFNFWWTILFFLLHSPLLALVDIILLWITVLVTIYKFAQYSKTAAWLLVPYISWVSFATLLNYRIWLIN